MPKVNHYRREALSFYRLAKVNVVLLLRFVGIPAHTHRDQKNRLRLQGSEMNEIVSNSGRWHYLANLISHTKNQKSLNVNAKRIVSISEKWTPCS